MALWWLAQLASWWSPEPLAWWLQVRLALLWLAPLWWYRLLVQWCLQGRRRRRRQGPARQQQQAVRKAYGTWDLLGFSCFGLILVFTRT